MNRPNIYDWPREAPRLLFWNMPNSFNDLVFVRLAVESQNVNENDLPNVLKLAHPKTKFRLLNYSIWKCRELIFSEDLILASPDLENQTEILAIFPKNLLTSERTVHLLKTLDLTVLLTEEVISSEFKTCLSYTINTRLTNKWHIAGNLLVEGRDFLSKHEPVNAIKLEVFVTPEECYFALEGYPVRFPKMELKYLGVNPEMLEEFQNRDLDCIRQYFIRNPWCHILPSMKRGEISSVTHTIPETSVFSSYQELQHYWRNTYGYQLPHQLNNNVFYNVHFRMIDNELFTYPECCIRASNTVIIPRIDQSPIIDSFLSDMLSVMPTICGIPWQFNDKLLNATLQLTSATEIQPNANVGPHVNKFPIKVGKCQEPSGFVKAISLLRTSNTDITKTLPGQNPSPNWQNIVAKVVRTVQDPNLNMATTTLRKQVLEQNIQTKPKKDYTDLERMAAKGQLGKVKCSILADWLREKGFTYKKGTKKVELTDNVYKMLKTLKPEP